MPSATDRPADHQPYVFVSYASADRERVLPIVDALTRAGVPVWIDREGIAVGESYAREITEAIERCAALVLLCSAASLASRNVKQEIALAWKYAHPYLPLLLEVVPIPKDVEYFLETAQWIEILDTPQRRWLPRILTALEPFGITPTWQRDETVLAGRERELTFLRERFIAARAGHGGLVLIGGEAGIGKTALAEALCAHATAQGARVFVGRCYDLTETPPYGPWIELFGHYQLENGPPLPAAFAQRGTVGAVTSQVALFQQVEDFIISLAAQCPLVLLLDDLHWTDPASLDLLRSVTRYLATLPLLLLVSYRADEVARNHPLYPLLPVLVREARADRLDVRPLTSDGLRDLLASRYRLGPADAIRLIAYLQERTEGNPFFLGELLRALEEEGALRTNGDGWALGDLTRVVVPTLLRQVIDSRVARLDPTSQRLLSVAAVIGQEVPLGVWAAVGAADEDEILTTAERALEARLLAEAGGERVRFAHALIREALYEGIPAIRRRGIHRRAGDLLATMSAPDPDLVASHFQQAGDARAVPWLLRAGERAQRAYAWSTAAARLADALATMETHSLDPPEKGWLLFRLGGLNRYMGPQYAVKHFDAARQFAADTGDALLEAVATAYGGSAHNYATDYRRGMPLMGAGIAMLDALSPAEHARYQELVEQGFFVNEWNPHATYSAWLSIMGRHAEAHTLAGRIVTDEPDRRSDRRSDSHRRCNAYQALARVHAMQGRPEEAHRNWALASAAYREIEHHTLAASAALQDLGLVVLPYHTDQIAERQRVADEAEQAWARASGSLGNAGLAARVARLPLLIIEGAWGEVWQLTAPMKGGYFFLHVMYHLARLARAQGDVERAWTTIDGLLPAGLDTGPGDCYCFHALELQRVAAGLSLDAGDMDATRQWLEAHDRLLDWSETVLGRAEGRLGWAAYYRATGDAERAHQYAERALLHATEPRQPLALVAALRLVGELDTEAGRYEGAASHLDESLALADACEAPYERALTLMAMAELHAATGDNEDARRLLDEVRVICEPLGAKPTLARADALVARLT